MPEIPRPFTSFNFAVEINRGEDGHPLVNAAFAECDGLEMTMEVKTIREGGANDRQIRLNGMVAYGQLTLKRGILPKAGSRHGHLLGGLGNRDF